MPISAKEAARKSEALRRKAMLRSASEGGLGEEQGSGLLRLLANAKHKLHVPGFGAGGGDVERAGSGDAEKSDSLEDAQGLPRACPRRASRSTFQPMLLSLRSGRVTCLHSAPGHICQPAPLRPTPPAPPHAAAADFVVGLHRLPDHPDRWHILRGCSGSVHGGQVVGLLGPSGERLQLTLELCRQRDGPASTSRQGPSPSVQRISNWRSLQPRS